MEELLKIDVQPMLSIFRPMPNTVYRDYMSPQVIDIVKLYEDAEKLCESKVYETESGHRDPTRVMHLGPDCTPCQNNTVALPYKSEHH